MLHNTITKLIEEASQAQATRAHTPVGLHEPTVYISVPAARSTVACLKVENLPALFDKGGRLIRTPNSAPSGVSIKLDAGLVAGSRVAAAGAHVVVFPEAFTPRQDPSGTIAVERVPAALRNIEAASFGTVDVDSEADAPVIPLPVFVAAIDWTDSVAKGVRIEIPRSARRRVETEQLSAEIVASLTLGLARAADQVLLAALAAAPLAPFTLAHAAAQGLAFAELRALIGTAGAGALVDQDGALRAAGITAELTGDVAGTFVGAWNRAGVAVKDDVSIHFERLDTAGSLAVTVWANMIPLLPDANKFWTVA